MTRRNRKRSGVGNASRVPAPKKSPSRRRWWPFVFAGAVLVLVAMIALIRQRDGETSLPSYTPNSTSMAYQDMVRPPPPPGFYSGAPRTGPYDCLNHRSQCRAWALELLDQHPDYEFAMRLKGYFEARTAEVDFESVAVGRIERGEVGYALAYLSRGISPPVPIFTFDTIIFDRRYTTPQEVFRIISHEGLHLDEVMQGLMPVELLHETPEHPYTQEDIRILYEGEVRAFKKECLLAHGRPDYRINNIDRDHCDDYEREGVSALRRMVAEVYTVSVPGYERHREYIFRLAKDPFAR